MVKLNKVSFYYLFLLAFYFTTTSQLHTVSLFSWFRTSVKSYRNQAYADQDKLLPNQLNNKSNGNIKERGGVEEAWGEEKQEQEIPINLVVLDQTIASARSLRPYLMKRSLCQSSSKVVLGTCSAEAAKEVLDNAICNLVRVKDVTKFHERKRLLRSANQQLYGVWCSLKLWHDIVQVLAIKKGLMKVLLESTPGASIDHVKVFREHLACGSIRNDGVELLIEGSLYALAIAKAKESEVILKNVLNEIEVHLARIPIDTGACLGKQLTEAQKKLKSRMKLYTELSLDPLANFVPKWTFYIFRWNLKS